MRRNDRGEDDKPTSGLPRCEFLAEHEPAQRGGDYGAEQAEEGDTGWRQLADPARTNEGRDLIDRALPDHLTTERRLLATLTSAQRDALADTLRGLLETLGDTPD